MMMRDIALSTPARALSPKRTTSPSRDRSPPRSSPLRRKLYGPRPEAWFGGPPMTRITPAKYLDGMVIFPHLTTALTVCCGFTILVATSSPELCLLACAVGLFTDVLDGAVARQLNASSAVGANFDMVADLSCFGIAPSAFFARQQLGGSHDVLVLLAGGFYMLVACFRIAREITAHNGTRPFAFVGVPTNLASVFAMITAYRAPKAAWPSAVLLALAALMMSKLHVPKGLGLVKLQAKHDKVR